MAAAASPIEADLPDWAAPLFRPARYKVLYGGRGSGKTWTIAAALVLQASLAPLRIACVREHQKSIQESAKKTIENWIHRLGLSAQFRIFRNTIAAGNGSYFFFAGMSTATEEDIRGWEDVDRVWVEEAHRMSESSREILYPTIRKPGSELWFSFNPRYRYDPVWRDFIARPRPGAWVQKVNWGDNPWFPDALDAERRFTQREEPERYAHIWLGEPDDAGAERKVLPYELLAQCIDAWPRRLAADGSRPAGVIHAGLDVADSGADRNALAARRGPVVFHAERWPGVTLGATTRRADAWLRANGAAVMYYDVGGVGAGVRSHLRELEARAYKSREINFGGAVGGAKSQFTRGVSNADFFFRRNSQLGWAVQMRARNTTRLLDDASIDPPLSKCLFIDPELPRLEAYLAQLSQPEWRENLSGQVVIDKQPDDAPSPDLYDATVLSFAADSDHGLRRPA